MPRSVRLKMLTSFFSALLLAACTNGGSGSDELENQPADVNVGGGDPVIARFLLHTPKVLDRALDTLVTNADGASPRANVSFPRCEAEHDNVFCHYARESLSKDGAGTEADPGKLSLLNRLLEKTAGQLRAELRRRPLRPIRRVDTLTARHNVITAWGTEECRSDGKIFVLKSELTPATLIPKAATGYCHELFHQLTADGACVSSEATLNGQPIHWMIDTACHLIVGNGLGSGFFPQYYTAAEIGQVARTEGTANSYLTRLFNDTLGRPPTPEDLRVFRQTLFLEGRGAVARTVMLSQEGKQAFATRLYRAFLLRDPLDASETLSWAKLHAPTTDVPPGFALSRGALLAYFAGSDEYYCLHVLGDRRCPTSSGGTLPDGAEELSRWLRAAHRDFLGRSQQDVDKLTEAELQPSIDHYRRSAKPTQSEKRIELLLAWIGHSQGEFFVNQARSFALRLLRREMAVSEALAFRPPQPLPAGLSEAGWLYHIEHLFLTSDEYFNRAD